MSTKIFSFILYKYYLYKKIHLPIIIIVMITIHVNERSLFNFNFKAELLHVQLPFKKKI